MQNMGFSSTLPLSISAVGVLILFVFVQICDNMPQHRRLGYEQRIRDAVVNRGALLIWGPPMSPDLNGTATTTTTTIHAGSSAAAVR